MFSHSGSETGSSSGTGSDEGTELYDDEEGLEEGALLDGAAPLPAHARRALDVVFMCPLDEEDVLEALDIHSSVDDSLPLRLDQMPALPPESTWEATAASVSELLLTKALDEGKEGQPSSMSRKAKVNVANLGEHEMSPFQRSRPMDDQPPRAQAPARSWFPWSRRNQGA